MTSFRTSFRTTVVLLRETRLLPARWHVEHACLTCRELVATEELVDHARDQHAEEQR